MALPVPLPSIKEQIRLVEGMDAAQTERKNKLAEADALLAGLDDFLIDALGIKPPSEDPRRVFAVRLTQPRSDGRLNSDYYHPERMLALRALDIASKQLTVEPLARVASFERNLG